MENTPLAKRSVAFGVALAVACIVSSIIVVIKEKNAAVMNGLKSVLGHHWTTHSAIVVVLFLGLGFVLGLFGIRLTTGKLITTIVGSVVVAALTIVGFYLFVD